MVKNANERPDMAYRYGDRYQMSLTHTAGHRGVRSRGPVRVYDEFIESLDFAELGI